MKGLFNAIQQHKLLFRCLWVGLTIADDRSIDHAITIEKYGWPQSAHFVLSHFVAFRLSFGCETNRCQYTAWKASE